LERLRETIKHYTQDNWSWDPDVNPDLQNAKKKKITLMTTGTLLVNEPCNIRYVIAALE